MSAAVLRIDGEFGICRAVELKQLLLAALEPGMGLALDLSAVTELDSAGIQLLLLAKREAQSRRRQLRLVAISPAVQASLALLNLERHFEETEHES